MFDVNQQLQNAQEYGWRCFQQVIITEHPQRRIDPFDEAVRQINSTMAPSEQRKNAGPLVRRTILENRRTALSYYANSTDQIAWLTLALVTLYIIGGVHLYSIILGTGPLTRTLAVRSGGNLVQYIFLLLMAVLFVFNWIHSRRAPNHLVPFGLAIIFAWCLLSAVWAIDPLASLRRSLVVIMTTICIYDSVARLRIERSIGCILLVSCAYLFADYMSVPIGLGVHQSNDLSGALVGDWHGLHAHKNEAGAFTAALFVMTFWLFVERRNPLVFVLHVAAAIFLYKTQSKTSIIAGATASYVLWLPYVLQKRIGLLLTFSLVTTALASALALLYFYGASFQLETTSFTGRGEIWLDLLPFAKDHLLLGAGYGSFWGIDDSPVFHLSYSFVSKLQEAHNGYLDATLEIGLPATLYTAYYFFFRQPYRALSIRGFPHCGMFVGLILFSMIHNFLESALLTPDVPSWFFLLFSTGCIRAETESLYKIKRETFARSALSEVTY